MRNIALIASVVAVAACASLPYGNSSSQDVSIRFAAEVNGQPFECGKTYNQVGITRSAITPTDFRMYVSEVHLLTAQGQAVPVQLKQDQTWQFENIALLDFENGSGPCRNGTPATHTTIDGTAPEGHYVGIRFTLGVPFNRNHGDPTVSPAPLNTTAMFWTWQGGYKFLKFDTQSSGMQANNTSAGASHGGGAASGFSVHLGSTVCASPSRTQAPSACQNPNRVEVTFADFDPKRNTLVADIGKVLTAANVDVNAPNTSPGCMSFPKDADCPPVMGALGLAYDGQPAKGPQQFISKR